MIIQHQVHRRGNWGSIRLCPFQKPLGFYRLGSLFIHTKDQIFRGFQLSPSSSLDWAFLFGCLLLPIPISLPNFPTSSLSQLLRNDSSLWYSHLIINKPFPSILHFIFSPFCTSHPPYLALWTSHWIYCKCNPLVLLPQFLTSDIHNTLYHVVHWKLCLDYIFESVHCFICKR